MNPFLFGATWLGIGLGWARIMREMLAEEATREEARRPAAPADGPALTPGAPPV